MASLMNGRLLLRAGRALLRQSQIAQETHMPAISASQTRLWPLQGKWYSSDGESPKFTKNYFEKLVKDKPLVLFMKGEPSAPMCGFSRLVVQILTMHGLSGFPSYDVLEDVDFKEGMKEFSNWPTFPQVYMNGELVGGADILLQMHQNGELVTELDKIGHKSALLDNESSKQS